MVVDTELLILAIEKYACLWNTSVEDYHNKSARDVSWISVCQDLIEGWNASPSSEKQIQMNELKKRWTNIRDYFRKELANERTIESGQAVKKRKKYVYFDVLSFLRPVYDRRKTDINYSEVKIEDIQIYDTEELYSTEAPSTSHSPIPSTSHTQQPSSSNIKDKKRKQLNAFESSLIKAIEKKNSTTAEAEDADLHFLKSLLPDMKLLSDSKKFEFKLGIMQLLGSLKN